MMKIIWIETWEQFDAIADNEGFVHQVNDTEFTINLPADRPYRFHPDFPWGPGGLKVVPLGDDP
jgi:hypothetical protein